jgi:hypothetical protein
MPTPDYTALTWEELADAVRAIWTEAKRRNPIGINLYSTPFAAASANLKEIAKAEAVHPTSECGPGIDNAPKKRPHLVKAKEEPK